MDQSIYTSSSFLPHSAVCPTSSESSALELGKQIGLLVKLPKPFVKFMVKMANPSLGYNVKEKAC